MSLGTVAVFKPGVLVKTRHAIGICSLEAGAKGRIKSVTDGGYVNVAWTDHPDVERGIHYEHLEIVEAP